MKKALPVLMTMLLAFGIANAEGSYNGYYGSSSEKGHSAEDTTNGSDDVDIDVENETTDESNGYYGGDGSAEPRDRTNGTQQREEDPDKIGDIEDVNEIQRRKQSKRFGVGGFGPAAIREVETEELAYDFYGGYVWEVNPFAAIKGIADVTTDFDRATLVSGNIGANFYPFNADVSPYIGGDLGLGYLASEDQDELGFTAGASLGALLFRTTSTQLNLEAKTRFQFNDIDGSYPFAYTARVGVQF
jgi:hypothetical protein